MAKYPLLRPGGQVIDQVHLSGYIEAAAYDVLHDETLSPEEKVAGLHALARLARDLGDHWGQVNRYFSAASRVVWHRSCGLDREGMPHPDMIVRLAQVGEDTPSLLAFECDTPEPKHRAPGEVEAGGEHDA